MPRHSQIPFAPRERRLTKLRAATAESERAAHAQFHPGRPAPVRPAAPYPTENPFGAWRDGFADPLFEYFADERRRNGVRTQ